MTALDRREFLASLGTAGLAAATSGWFTERLFTMVQEGTLRPARGPGFEKWVPSLCRLCPAACGIRVRLVDGLPVGLEGNRTDPVSAGGLCPAGLAGLQDLVHPDRLRTPMRRDGPRGSGRWTAISWDQALEEIATALRQLRHEGRPQAFAVLERGDSPLTRFWLERILRAYGSPNLILDDTHETWRAAWAFVAGSRSAPAADLANSDFILSFGHELFETDGHPVWQSKVWGRLRAPSVLRPATLAYVGPRISPTAARADLRTAIRPGQEAVMALGLIHILLTEDLMDRSFLARWASGYDRPVEGRHEASDAAGEGFESFVRRRYTPEEVSRRTGVPASEIFRLGRAFGGARRPVALAGPAALRGEDGLAVAMAVVALNLARGLVGSAGGYVAAGNAPFALPAPPEPDDVARRGLASPRLDGAGTATLSVVEQSPRRMFANLAGASPSPLQVLLVHGVNPFHEWAGCSALEQALANTGLIVAMVRVPDETAAQADLILPEAGHLESWGLLPSPHGLPLDYAGLQQPAVEPLYESRSFEDAWFALARRLGGPAAAAAPGGTYAEWLPEAATGLFAVNRGTLAGGDVQERIAGFMETRGWKVPGPATPAAFWEALRRSGAWVDLPRQEHSPAEVLGPGVERFSFWPARLLRDAGRLAGAPVASEAIYAGGGGSVTTGPEAVPSAEAYPLRLLLFDTNTIWRGRTALTPLMLEMSGHREDIAWDSWLDIHPDTARRHRIVEGDRVRLESPAGSLLARARLTSTVPPDAVAMPQGLGHRHFGRFADGVGANPAPLVPVCLDPWTGVNVHAIRVRLAPAPA
jgi:anaerobic selenocysteine-containing dehydrogenase